MPADLILIRLVPILIAAYLCLLGPGHAWWRGSVSALPTWFTRVALSVATTSLVGLALTVLESFSLPRLVAINGLLTLIGYLQIGRVRYEGPARGAASGLGIVVFVAALWAYWPAYEATFAASDATTYTASGVHLARAHHLWKKDELAAELPPQLSRRLFFSVLGHSWKPPYARMPGGLVIESRGSDVVQPSFFPLPIVWSALFADAFGAPHAGGYAPLFCALAVWATWYFVRRRMGFAAALTTTTMIALNAACYWAARIPLSEPLAWFFLWSGLLALDAWEDDGLAADARLAGLFLGLAGLSRVEFLLFIVCALALKSLLHRSLAARPLTLGFYAMLAATIVAMAIQSYHLRGAYLSPLIDTLRGLQYVAWTRWTESPWAVTAGLCALTAAGAAAVRFLGLRTTVLAAGIVAFVAVYVSVTTHARVVRSIGWLSAYLGTATVALALPGLWLAWRSRFHQPGNGFLVVLVLFFGGLLLYNPHVIPNMPWASRRFVPLVVPALLILAALACVRISRRTVIGAAAAWLLVIVPVLRPLPALSKGEFFGGTHEQLSEFASGFPRDAILLIDSRLSAFILGTPLWLAHDLNSLPVQTASLSGRRDIAGIVATFADKRPIFLIKPTLSPPEPITFVAGEHTSDYSFAVLLPEQTAAEPPRVRERYIQSVSVFRLRRPSATRRATRPTPSTTTPAATSTTRRGP